VKNSCRDLGRCHNDKDSNAAGRSHGKQAVSTWVSLDYRLCLMQLLYAFQNLSQARSDKESGSHERVHLRSKSGYEAVTLRTEQESRWASATVFSG